MDNLFTNGSEELVTLKKRTTGFLKGKEKILVLLIRMIECTDEFEFMHDALMKI